MGYDSDSPKSRGECGKCGVAVDTLKDMEILGDLGGFKNRCNKSPSPPFTKGGRTALKLMTLGLRLQRGISFCA